LLTLGWVAAVWVIAMVGVMVATTAWWLSRHQPLDVASNKQQQASSTVGIVPLTLLAYAAVGAAALILEVGWTRLFGMLLLRTEYVMAIILAVFLVGIGVGSLLARRLRAGFWFDLLPVVAAVFALLSLWFIPQLAAWAEQADFNSLAAAMLAQGLAMAARTLPVNVLRVRLAADGEQTSGAR